MKNAFCYRMLFSWSKGQSHPQFGSRRVLIQLTVWVSLRGAGRKRQQSVIRPPSPPDMSAVVTHEVVKETNKGWSHIPPVRGGSHVQVWSQVRWGAAEWRLQGGKLQQLRWVTALLQYDVWSMTTKIGTTGDPGCLPAWYSAAPATDSGMT